MCDYRRGFVELDLLTTYTQLEVQVITALANLHTLQITTALANLFSVCCVISSSIATASNSGDSRASRAQVLSSQPPVQNSTLNQQVTTNCVAPTVFLTTTLHGPSIKHRFQQ
jgi:hypothetical protein